VKVLCETQFEGFEDLYEQVLDIDDQLLCHEVQIKADETYDDLKKSFEVFQNKLRTLMLRAKHKKLQNLRQMTIHDYYVR
jgi:ribosome-associated translation inhibitor RaiA